MLPPSASCQHSSRALAETPLLPERSDRFPIVVGTHPHEDHIGGMPEFIELFGDSIREYWEPGYYHPGPGYMGTMHALEVRSKIQHSQPTSGFTRYVGQVKVVVLAPAIGLRNNFDSYGVNINNASIALKLEFPAARVEQRDDERRYLRLRRIQGLLLGADAQTASWGRVMTDFPELRPSESPVAKALRMALGADPLRAQVFKVPHHASKHGVSLELVELIEPDLTLISSAGGGGKYNFPHTVAQESVHEALEASRLDGQTAQPRLRPRNPLHVRHGLSRGPARLDRNRHLANRPQAAPVALWRSSEREGRPRNARLYEAPARIRAPIEPDTVPV